MEALAEADFPPLFRVADASAADGQHRLLTATALRLSALLAAAVLGAFSVPVGRLDAAALLAAAGLGTALVIEVYLLTERPDRQWYESRAAAESAKTLVWRFAVAGQPFGADTGDRAAESLLLHRFSVILGNMHAVSADGDDGSRPQVTDEMRAMRARPLEERRRAYRTGRILDQRRWYSRRAKEHGRSVARWSLFLASMEALGLVAAVLNAVGVFGLDLPGIAGAVAAGGLAWVQTRQHQQLATAYGIAAQELADISTRLRWPETEAEWAHFVDEVEEAISREHTLWWASHV
ncbi:DUF4231 domain-containing protein [Actinomadura nitritigenes]|uniref:DUF4231 domain-containing protein n=1 Tax=Actinomadura nitritigenes TaxID=134602 RepID=UPI003D8DD5DA